MTRAPIRGVCFAALAALLVGGCTSPDGPAASIVIRGGRVIDGSGEPARIADVVIANGRIRTIGSAGNTPAARVIDATGLVVAPGFIDMHSHADLILLAEPRVQEQLMAAKIAQGVTTVVVGNCGLGVAPADPEAQRILSAINAWMTPAGIRTEAMEVAGYLDRLEQQGIVLNAATLIPHGPLRITAMGLAPGRPGAEQLQQMRAALDQGLDAGAFGLSTGLIYPPGMYSDTEELIALAGSVAARDRLFTAHVRGSSETLLAATEELIRIARESGARVHHSHLEAVGERFWPRIARVLALEDRARNDGIRISHDVFPYTRAATMMSAIFPPWALEGGVPRLLERLEDRATRERIRLEIETRRPGWPPWEEGGWPHNLVGAVSWSGILISSVGSTGPAEWAGRSVASIGAELERDPFDVVADLMLDQRGQVGQFVAEISGAPDRIEPLLSILGHPAAAIVSDAEDYGRGAPHPAHAGAFARALRLNREHELMPLPELIRRMTGYPASLIGLSERGRLRPGAAADLVVLDPDHVGDRATWDEPRLSAEGIEWVVLNGAIIVDRGRYRGGSHGQVLRSR